MAPDATNATEKRPPALAWSLLVLPPLAVMGSVGLGLFIDSLRLGPVGFFFVLFLIGPGALTCALTCAVFIIPYLSRGSLFTKLALWVLEIVACLGVHAQAFLFIGPGWG